LAAEFEKIMTESIYTEGSSNKTDFKLMLSFKGNAKFRLDEIPSVFRILRNRDGVAEAFSLRSE